MISIILAFFDELLQNLFIDVVNEKIHDILEKRQVERTITRCSDGPSQALESYFRNEELSEENINEILIEIKNSIIISKLSAKIFTSIPINAEKFSESIITEYGVPSNIREKKLEWPFKMTLQIVCYSLCEIGVCLSEWEKEGWRKDFEAFDKLFKNQELNLATLGPGGEGTLDERFERIYKSFILRRFSQIDTATLRFSSNLFVRLLAIFVQPDVVIVDNEKKESGSCNLEITSSTLVIERQKLLGNNEGSNLERHQAEDMIVKLSRCVVIGLPGSGKTTLLQHILLSAVNGELTFGEDKGMVPVFVKVQQLNSSIFLPGLDDLLQTFESSVFTGACPGFLKRQFELGRILLLIDGLDEIIPEKRQSLIQWITTLINFYPNSKYILSSRPAGYQSEEFLNLGFTELELCDFNSSQMDQYVYQWTKAVKTAEGLTPEEAEKTSLEYAKDLVERTQRNLYVRRIATNPLLLSAICLVQNYEKGDLPSRRVVLYERCIEGLLFQWDKKRGLDSVLESVPLGRKILILRRLALQMQIRGIVEISESDLEKSFQESFNSVGEEVSIIRVLENIRDRSGLLVERRPGVYGFSHLSFQEYLAALSINAKDFPEYDRVYLFAQRNNPQWYEVIALYAGIATKDNVEWLIGGLLRTKFNKSILLSGECLAASRGDVGIKIQKQVIEALLQLPDEVDDQHLQVQPILESLNEKVVFNEVAATLDNLESVHPTRYLYYRKDQQCIELLLKAGLRILNGEQKPAKWDHGITFNLLLIAHPEAANALRELTELTLKKGQSEKVNILLGFYDRTLWTLELKKNSPPGVFRYLIEPTVTDEQSNVCKYISLVTSKEFLSNIKKESVGHKIITRSIFFSDDMITGLNELGRNGNEKVRQIIGNAVTQIEFLQKSNI
jgi:hypothetical protein